jgi:large subunit ribosomal protein L17
MTHERLITTLPKARELRPFAERAITHGKRALTADAPEAALHQRRLAAAYFQPGNSGRTPDGGYKRPRAPRTAGVFALDKLFDEIAARFADRPGGYTRILKLGARRGDGAEMALIELIGSEAAAPHQEEKKEEKKKRRFFGRKKAEKTGTAEASAKPGRSESPKARDSKGSEASGKTGSRPKKKSAE